MDTIAELFNILKTLPINPIFSEEMLHHIKKFPSLASHVEELRINYIDVNGNGLPGGVNEYTNGFYRNVDKTNAIIYSLFKNNFHNPDVCFCIKMLDLQAAAKKDYFKFKCNDATITGLEFNAYCAKSLKYNYAKLGAYIIAGNNCTQQVIGYNIIDLLDDAYELSCIDYLTFSSPFIITTAFVIITNALLGTAISEIAIKHILARYKRHDSKQRYNYMRMLPATINGAIKNNMNTTRYLI